ncbi:hypothetical protein EYF80_063557 [Liparis tanakae]|uniref:Uncharacterized protein n=1 Tax=Liparis tanakae TaxID=230148 RepID=A0A4Z2EBU5_9TELE|nr:hypothetical protein EYF80_063557 [Liparis tanakae]
MENTIEVMMYRQSTECRELTPACPPSPPLHTRSLCVCSASENEGRPRRTITTKHIPSAPQPPAAQTQTQGLYVYQASRRAELLI